MPNNWKTYKLKEIVNKDRGISYGIVQPGNHVPNGIPILKINNITNSSYNLKNLQCVSPEVESKYKRTRLEGGELLLSLVGTLGEIYYVPEEMKGLNVVRALAVIPVLKEFSPTWVEYCLKSPNIQNQLNQIATTSVQATINLKEVREIEIQFPEQKEREEVASILSAIDDKIENNLAINKTLEEMAMALYKHWFVDFGPFQDGKFVESELGMIPEGWEVKKIKDFGEIICGKTPSKKDEENYSNDGYPFIKIPDMHNNIWVLNTTEKISEKGNRTQIKKLLPTGSINVSCIATVGLVSMNCFPAHTNQQINSIVPNNDFYRNYLYLSMIELKETFLNEASGGSATLNMNTSTFSNVKVLMPNENTLNEFDVIVKDYFVKVKMNQLENQTLTQLRDTLLPKLISGEVRLKAFRE